MKIKRKLMQLILNINHGLIKFSIYKEILFYLYRYVDLLQMVQPDYSEDHIILLLLKEMEEFADVNEYFFFEGRSLIIFVLFFSRVKNLLLFDLKLF